MKKWNIVIPDGLHSSAVEALKNKEWALVDLCLGDSQQDKDAKILGADFVIVRSATQLTKEKLAKAKNLKGVIRAGVGVDNIDIEAAESLGVYVWNAPNGNFQAAAEHAMALIFALARQIGPAYAAGKANVWNKKKLSSQGRQLQGACLGLYGAGNIGQRVAKMGAALGMRVNICDPFFNAPHGSPYNVVDFDQLLAEGDFISIHAPLLDSTKHVFNKEAFKKMKPTSFLINAARGGIVCEKDLLEALNAEQIEGVALDVFEVEPFDSDFYKQLLQHDKMLSTPHLGASTQEAQTQVGLDCVKILEGLWSHFEGKNPKTPQNALNKPQNARI